jgi:hypothetical protein
LGRAVAEAVSVEAVVDGALHCWYVDDVLAAHDPELVDWFVLRWQVFLVF